MTAFGAHRATATHAAGGSGALLCPGRLWSNLISQDRRRRGAAVSRCKPSSGAGDLCRIRAPLVKRRIASRTAQP